MKNAIIACEMMRDEVNLAIKSTNCQYPIVWLEDTLHMYPNQLRDSLQHEIDKFNKDQYDYILFAYGYCGNAFIGIESGNSSLVIPDVNDCTDLLLDGTGVKSKCKNCYYLTRGWLESEKSIDKEYDFYINRYGEKRAKRIMDVMLANYKNMMLIDTGAYDASKYEAQSKALADRLGLDFLKEKGNTHILTKLFANKWDNQFTIIPPNTTITIEHLGNYDQSQMPQGVSL
ncbi:MAG: DUF1638 domain-containing protein [Anaerovoracaceae bacterium]